MLPTPYSKEHQPFEHFDSPEELALARVRSDIESGWAFHDQVCAHHGWYGHGTEVNHDKLIVTECGGVEMNKVFSYPALLAYVQQLEHQPTLFATK